MRKDRLRKPSTKIYIIRPAVRKVESKAVANKPTTGGCGCKRKNR